MTRRWALRPLGALLALLLLAGCSGEGTPGGAERLPDGSAPDDVTYAEAPDTAPQAPDFELRLLDGTQVTASELWEDRPVVLHFMASWCELCKEQQEELNAVAREYGDRVVFLGITSQDQTEDIEAYLRQRNVPYAVGDDPAQEVWLRYGVTEPPLLAFITKGGAIVRGHPGGLEGQALRDTIEEQLLSS